MVDLFCAKTVWKPPGSVQVREKCLTTAQTLTEQQFMGLEGHSISLTTAGVVTLLVMNEVPRFGLYRECAAIKYQAIETEVLCRILD